MLAALTKSIAKIFGTKQEKDIKAIQHLVDQIHVEYDKLSGLSHDALRQKTLEFKKRISDYVSNFDQSIAELRTNIQE
jgi:preprotein translocase subunit SecA